MSFRPMHDYCVVELEPIKEFSRGGIIRVAPEPVRTGVVKAIGPGRHYPDRFVPTVLKVGERIAFFQAVAQRKQGLANRFVLGENEELLRETDALFVLPKDATFEVTR